MDPEGRSPRDRILILMHRSKILVEDGDVKGALAMARPLVDEARFEGDIALYGDAASNVANILLHSYDVDGALETLVPVRAAAAEAGEDFVVAEIDIDICLCSRKAHATKSYGRRGDRDQSAGRAGLDDGLDPRFDLTRRSVTKARPLQGVVEQVDLGLADAPTGRILAQLHFVAALASTSMGLPVRSRSPEAS
jgi:hypothetical protein